jgi:non-specific serine/threonine protein kinase
METAEPADELPGSLTPLVGRDRELEEVGDLLRGGARLVTLVGPGGVGKTRLAIEVGATLRDEFAGGARFVQLAGIVDPALVLPTIARVLGVREIGSRPLRARLREEVGDRSLLLVLDNFEQVLAAATAVAELLLDCPGVQVLVTSRQRLAVRGEQVIPVPPLELPEPGREHARSSLEAPAVRLFVARAREADGGYTPDPAELPTLVEICRRVDGLPLAIELAAARVRVLRPAALLARLDRRLPVLTSGPRDLPARQRTLRDAIAWSYDHLSPPQQALFRRLSVFAGGFTIEAAEAATRGLGPRGQGLAGDSSSSPQPSTPRPSSVLDGIEALADASLVWRDDVGAGASEPRFAMLETIREFGLERLEEAGEEQKARGGHAAWFAGVAAVARPRLTGPEHVAWLERLEADHDNLRAALDWLAAQGDAGGAVGFASDLWLFWLMRGHLGEGRRYLAAVLALPEGPDPAARARALTGAGALAEAQGDDDTAAALLDEAVGLARSLERPDLLAIALLFRGVVAFDLNDRASAVACCRESVALAEAVGDAWCEGIALAQIGLVAVRERDYAKAEAELSRSLDRFRSLANRWGIAVTTGGLGILANDRGEYDRAALLLAESLTLFQAQGDRWGVAAYLEGAARAAMARRQAEQAARLFGAATALREAVGIAVKPVYRRSYDETLAAVRAKLGEAAFAAAWDEGRALTAAQAVAAAVRAAESGPEASEAPASARTPEAASGISLTGREREVLELLVEGHSDRAIGQALFIGHRTVATHVTNILNKLGVSSRTAAASAAVRRGLV